MDKIEAEITEVVEKIEKCEDSEERKQLREKERQLREKELILMRRAEAAAAPTTIPTESPDEVDYKKFPLYFDVLKRVGMQTPYEQYTLYVSFGAFVYGAYSPIRKAFFLNRWLHEADPSLKDIWAARANLSVAEQKGGERYLEELKRVPKRYAVLPLSFLLFEGIRSGYRKLSSVFSHKQ